MLARHARTRTAWISPRVRSPRSRTSLPALSPSSGSSSKCRTSSLIFVLDSFFLPFFSLLGPAFLILISWLICFIPFSSRCKTSGGLISFSFCQRGCLSIAPFFHFSPKQLPGSWKSLRETEIGAWSILEGQGPYEAGSTLPYDRLIRTKRTRDTFIDNRSDQRFSYIRKAGLSLLRDFTTTTGWRSEHLLPINNRACLH